MAKPVQEQLFFVSCEGPTGRALEGVKRQRNRHAQLAPVSSQSVRQAPAHTPLPLQVRFRVRENRRQSHRSHGASNLRKRQDQASFGLSANVGLLSDEEQQAACEAACLAVIPRPPGIGAIRAVDQKALSYFYHFAAIDLSGYLPGRFWDGLVLQAGRSDPLVQQALVALGSAHLDYCTTYCASLESLAAYQKALQKLRQYMAASTTPSREVVALCCILFFALCVMLQDQAAAATHLLSGMSILSGTRKMVQDRESIEDGASNSDTLHELSVMFMQLDIERTMQDVDRGLLLDLNSDLTQPTFTENNWNPQMTFCSPHDAMEPWMAVIHDMWRFIPSYSRYRRVPVDQVPPHVVEMKNAIQSRIGDCRRATKGYLRNHPVVRSITEKPDNFHNTHKERDVLDAINTLIIESHFLVVEGIIAESLNDERNPRPFDKNAEKLLGTARTAIALQKTYYAMHNIQPKNTFSTHVGIVEVLLLLSHRTSCPAIRTQAQHLIRQVREAQGGLTGLAAFFAGYGAPPSDFILIYEKPGH